MRSSDLKKIKFLAKSGELVPQPLRLGRRMEEIKSLFANNGKRPSPRPFFDHLQ